MIHSRIRIVAILSMLISLSACSILPTEYQPQEDPVRPPYSGAVFRTVEVERGDLRNTDTAHFTFEPLRQANLSFAAGGMRLAEIYVEAGDFVEEGMLLAELEGGEQGDLLEERKAALARADEQLAQLEADFEDQLEAERLWQDGLGHDADTKNAALDALRTEYETQVALQEEERAILEMEVQESEERVRTSQIYAPFDGVVTYTRVRSVGEIVRQNETIVELSDNSTSLFIGRLMDMGDILSDGTTWEIVSGDIPYPVQMINPEDYGIDRQEGIGYALVTVDDVQLEADSRGRIDVVKEESLDTLYLPRRAVFTIGDDAMVYMQRDDGMRYAQKVTTGIVTDRDIEITSGLEEGDIIVLG